MSRLNETPTPEEIRRYGSHVGFAWAVAEQRRGVGSLRPSNALRLAAVADESPLDRMIDDEAQGEPLFAYVARAVDGEHAANDDEAVAEFWRAVAQTVAMDSFQGLPHPGEFIRGFLDAQWLVFEQPGYHGPSLDPDAD